MINYYFTKERSREIGCSKLILTMKLTFLMVTIACLNVSAKVFSQEKLSLDMKNATLSKVLHLIEKQSSFRFVYSPTEGPFNKQVSVRVDKAPITVLLDQLLNGTSLVYTVQENNLVTISSKGKMQIDITVTGIVSDNKGMALPGVSVSVKGVKGLGTKTDAKGGFSLKVPENSTIIFTAIGYQTVEMPASTSTMKVVMQGAESKLDEVVIQAFGKTSKRKVTGAISTIDFETVAQLPVASINDGIAGRAQGIIVTTNSGAPGTKSTISIRGGGTPLYVIDNIIRSQSDFENINPNDVETYSILKDAEATALYGVSAANGVIIVTTKQGKEGKVNINYSFNQIFSQPTLFPKKVSSYDQLKAINDVYASEGLGLPTPLADLEKYRNGSDLINFPNTDWQKVGLKNFAPEMRHDFSLTSGTKELTYYASMSYFDQGSNLKTDQNYNRRTTYRLNTTSNFDKINLKVITGLDGYVENNVQPSVGYGFVYSHIQNRRPSQLAYNQFGLPSNNTTDNPAQELDPKSGYAKSLSRVFNGNLALEYSAPFLTGLKFKASGAYNLWNNIGKNWNVLAPTYANGSTTPIYSNPPNLFNSRSEGSKLTLQSFVTYNKTFGEHSIDFTGGYEQIQYTRGILSGTRTQYQLLFDQIIAGPTANQTVNGAEYEYGSIRDKEFARAGFIGRLGYTYKSKYTVEGVFRRDGSSLFPSGKQWGNFYALSGGYTISEESFMQSLKDKHILDFLKLRGSYGLTGNIDDIAPFQYISGYGISPIGWIVDGKPVQGTSEPIALPSTKFSWQTIKSRNLAIDFASLNNRLNGSVDYFYSRTTGFVVSDPRFAQTLGIGLPPINFVEGATRKEGAEFHLDWNAKVNNFTYKIGVNYTFFNTFTERNTENDATLKNPYTRGSGTAGSYFGLGYQSLGIYGSNNDLLNGAHIPNTNNVQAGDLKYLDANGDGQIDANDQRRIGKNTMPRSNYGITLDLGYKGFSFSAVVQGSGDRDRYIGDVLQGSSTQGYLLYGFQQDYWRPDNINAVFPRQTSSPAANGNNNIQASDFWLIHSKYVRLKYLQFGYDFKQAVLKKSPFQQLRLYVSGTNLLSDSKSQKYFIDPESDTNNYNYPVQRTLSFGVTAGF
jgi:TonB-linked SusC/RagA family outer membrane protein